MISKRHRQMQQVVPLLPPSLQRGESPRCQSSHHNSHPTLCTLCIRKWNQRWEGSGTWIEKQIPYYRGGIWSKFWCCMGSLPFWRTTQKSYLAQELECIGIFVHKLTSKKSLIQKILQAWWLCYSFPLSGGHLLIMTFNFSSPCILQKSGGDGDTAAIHGFYF